MIQLPGLLEGAWSCSEGPKGKTGGPCDRVDTSSGKAPVVPRLDVGVLKACRSAGDAAQRVPPVVRAPLLGSPTEEAGVVAGTGGTTIRGANDMDKRIGEVMTPYPKAIDADASVAEAAELMRGADVGDVIVLTAGRLCGILTDRDIVVRVVAAGRDPSATRVGDICTTEIAVLAPEEDVGDAVARMRERHVRRLPVVVDGQPIGMFSLGDLALEGNAASVLADISAAPPNR